MQAIVLGSDRAIFRPNITSRQFVDRRHNASPSRTIGMRENQVTKTEFFEIHVLLYFLRAHILRLRFRSPVG
jgi:hypothetical protein